ncbi:hypothetical protein [Lentzea sp. HUAS12]|uniref:hypothetical protein n=1 Tax=Lentzea sp. HUAS12 TaxID=2951806 RepID=UPI0020A1B47B|nr:hypothetical protein [Lentzea sp. HUAS12]USX53587.1 hypothetical protein ND450_05640 [Lentzea sp. HUAS12]
MLRGDPERPQSSHDRLPGLVADLRASGMDVVFATTVAGEPPDLLGRTGSASSKKD